MAPTLASADTISSQTGQVLPIGGNTACPQILATNLTPYVYDGALHSFEFTVPDASYVAVAGSVGGSSIPFNLMTRWGAPSGALKVHVDIATTPIRGTLPLTVTMLSSHGAGQPVCVTTVSMGVGSGPIQTTPAAPAPSVPTSGTYVPPTSGTGAGKGTTQGGTSGASAGIPKVTGTAKSAGTSSTSSGKSASATQTPITLGSLQNLAAKACATPLAAQRTWLVLLLVYILIVGAALWAEYPMSVPAMRTPERVAAIILVLLLLLLGFWYFSASCRTALWMPLVAVVIAILGLLAAFRNHPRMTQLLSAENPKSTS